MNTAEQDLDDLIKKHGLKGRLLKDFLRVAVRRLWPDFPKFSTYSVLKKNGPVIHETPTASVGSGTVLTWTKNGVRKVLLGQAGEHYEELYRRHPDHKGELPACYTIPGGFMTLAYTKGSTHVPASEKPETAYITCARELEEEFRVADGSPLGKPLLEIDPKRLKPMNTDTASFPGGAYMVVLGMMMELNADEIEIVEKHVTRLHSDPVYKRDCALLTINSDTDMPEIADKRIFDLEEVAADRVALLHKDQSLLFNAVKYHFAEIENAKYPSGPTL